MNTTHDNVIPMLQPGSIQAQFETFHKDNPVVYRQLVALAIEWLDQHQAAGMKMLWEVLRWQLSIDIHTGEEFKLNNNFTSRYARMLLDDFPEWEGRIKTRELRAV